MRTYKILVEEKRLVEYYIEAESKEEAKAYFKCGNYNPEDNDVVKIREERILKVD